MVFLALLFASAIGYFVGMYLPDRPESPYIPILISYHLFLTYLITKAVGKSRQKIRLSMSLPSAVITHFVCLAALIGVVMRRDLVPKFEFVQFLAIGLAPFEIKTLFKRRKGDLSPVERTPMPSGTNDEYSEFLSYMKSGERRFLKAGQNVNQEYAAWLKARHRTGIFAGSNPSGNH